MVLIRIKSFDLWTSMIRSALLFLSVKDNIKIKWIIDSNFEHGMIAITCHGNVILFDCLDTPDILVNTDHYYKIFKRSKSIFRDYPSNVVPLGFTFPLYYKQVSMVLKLFLNSPKNLCNLVVNDKYARIELVRFLDKFGLFTNSNSYYRSPKYLSSIGSNLCENNLTQKIVYRTRLWNPANVRDKTKKEQRELQNQLRIDWVKWLNQNYDHVDATIEASDFSIKNVEKKYLRDNRENNLMGYFSILMNSRLCFADDGLEDTLGWKIGEYVYLGRNIVTTPLSVDIPGQFLIGKNYHVIQKNATETEFINSVNNAIKLSPTLNNQYNIDYSIKNLYGANLLKNKGIIDFFQNSFGEK